MATSPTGACQTRRGARRSGRRRRSARGRPQCTCVLARGAKRRCSESHGRARPSPPRSGAAGEGV
eukprot:8934895-Pyramimonas_sp.AAC.1